MAQEIKIVINAVGKGIRETTGSLVSGLEKSKKAYTAFNASIGNGNRIMNGLAGSVRNLVAAYAGLSALASVNRIMQDSETAAYNMQSSVNAANREFENVGTVGEWESAIARLSDELKIYSNTSLKNAISRTVDMTKRLGLSKDQMEEVIKRSADLGAGKTTLEEAIERVTAALRGEAEASEFLGLTLNENYIKSWYEANNVTEKAWKNLTDIEKAQIRYQVMLEQSNELQGRAADSAETFAGSVALVRKEVDNAIAENQDLIQAMNQLAAVMRENAEEIGLFVSQVITFAARLVELAVKYKNFLGVLAGTAAVAVTVSKLVAVFHALDAAFIILTGGGIVRWLASLRSALAVVSASTSALAMAFKGFVLFAAAQGVVYIYNAVRAFMDMRSATKDAKAAQEDLFKTTDRVMKQYDEFKDIRLPEDITGQAPAQLEALRKGLQRAKAYWVALQESLRAKSEETTFLGTATQEALAAQRELKTVNQRLAEVNSDLERVGAAAKLAGAGMREPAEAVQATTDQLKQFEEQATKAYEHARDQAQKYAEEVISWEEKIQYARMSTEDKLRELGRKGLSDEQQWNDRRQQAEEKLAAAKKALREKDFDLAEDLARDAEGLYAGLAEEIKGIDGAGGDFVIRSIDDTKRVAMAGVKEVGAFVEQLYQTQKSTAEQSKKQWEDTATKINEKLDWVARARETNVNITLDNLTQVQSQINDLIKDETKHITVVVTEKVQREVARSDGGPVLHASSGRFIRRPHGRFPGDSPKDSVPVLARPGEWFIKNEAGKYWDRVQAGFMYAVNNPMSSLGQRIAAAVKGAAPSLKMSLGGMIPPKKFSVAIPRMPQTRLFGQTMAGPARSSRPDSASSELKDFGKVVIDTGKVSFPALVTQDVVKELNRHLRKTSLMGVNS